MNCSLPAAAGLVLCEIAVETIVEVRTPDLVLEAKLATLPTSPGVYLFKGGGGEVIYVGKAKNLRARVRQYARGGDGRVQLPFLLAQLTDVEILITSSEKEALLLENTLIKQNWPRYNIRLKDE